VFPPIEDAITVKEDGAGRILVMSCIADARRGPLKRKARVKLLLPLLCQEFSWWCNYRLIPLDGGPPDSQRTGVDKL